jgi:hypothetical protein
MSGRIAENKPHNSEDEAIMEPNLVCAVLSGQTSRKERTEGIADAFRDCPYTYFMATKKNTIFAVMFITPARARIWTENQKRRRPAD